MPLTRDFTQVLIRIILLPSGSPPTRLPSCGIARDLSAIDGWIGFAVFICERQNIPSVHHLPMVKAFTIREGMRGEFRFDVQNATNRRSFGAPSSRYGNPDFRRITGYKGSLGPRVAQPGLKFRF